MTQKSDEQRFSESLRVQDVITATHYRWWPVFLVARRRHLEQILERVNGAKADLPAEGKQDDIPGEE